MNAEAEGRQAAEEFRNRHQLGLAPIDDIIDLAYKAGYDVVCLSTSADEHGITARDNVTGTTVIIANNAVPAVRFRSNVAHELGHLQFPADLTLGGDHPLRGHPETRANSFARHLLLPVAAASNTRDEWPSATSLDLLNALVRHYGLSPAMATYQMSNAQMILQSEVQDLAKFTTPELARRYGWQDLNAARDVAAQVSRPPRHLTDLAIAAYREGRLLAPELARILGMTVSQVLDDHGTIEPAARRGRRQASHLTDMNLLG